jgi:hypothetical protein
MACQATPPFYTVTDLGELGYSSRPDHINNLGQVAGIRWQGPQAIPFWWENETLHDLPSLVTGGYRAANDINNLGTVGGYCNAADGMVACVWNNAQPTLVDSSVNSAVVRLNDVGQMVLSRGENYFYDQGQTQYIGGTVTKLTNQGAVCGWDSTNGGWIWAAGQKTRLGGATCNYQYAYDMNESGTVVGTGFLNNVAGGLFWADGQVQLLSSLGTQTTPLGINDPGQIVGSFQLSGALTGFVYDAGQMYNLNALLAPQFSQYHITQAVDINDGGQILALCTGSNNDRVVILNPILEPATLSLLALGGLAMLRRSKGGR